MQKVVTNFIGVANLEINVSGLFTNFAHISYYDREIRRVKATF